MSQEPRTKNPEPRDTGKAQPDGDQRPFALPRGISPAQQPETPPDGPTRFQRAYPALYASRHVVIAVLKVVLPLLGIGALIVGLLPQIDLSWVAELGSSIRSLLPGNDTPRTPPEWIVGIRNSDWFAWARSVFRWAKWLLPILIAIIVAIEEFKRHQRKQRGADEAVAADQTERQEEQAKSAGDENSG